MGVPQNKIKMKTIFLTILIIFFSLFSVKAQDFLVTTDRDSLNCELGKLKNDHYPITYIMGDQIISGLIHKDSILFYKKDFFRGMDNNRLRPWYPLVELGFDAGVAYQFGKFRIEDEYLTNKNHFGAQMGYYLGADLTYYASKQTGFGLKYNFRSLLDGDIHYNYLGPMIAFRLLERKQSNYLFFILSGGVGWMNQKNAPIQYLLYRPRIDMYSRSISGDVAVGYNFKLAKYISLRLKVSCIIGYPNFIKIEDYPGYIDIDTTVIDLGDYCRTMNTFNLTAGFSFHK